MSEFETRKMYIYRDWLKGDVIRVNAKMPFRLHFAFFFIGAYDTPFTLAKGSTVTGYNGPLLCRVA